jgi:L-iditol 2-dehydrogenase
LCEALQAIGVTRDGGFAEYVVMPQSQAIVLPAGLDPRHGAFSEPLACMDSTSRGSGRATAWRCWAVA